MLRNAPPKSLQVTYWQVIVSLGCGSKEQIEDLLRSLFAALRIWQHQVGLTCFHSAHILEVVEPAAA